MCLRKPGEKSQCLCSTAPKLGICGERLGFSSPPLPSTAWWGVCLHHPTGLLGLFSHLSCVGCAQPWGEGCCPPYPDVAPHPLQLYLSASSHLTIRPLRMLVQHHHPKQRWRSSTWRTIVSQTGDRQGKIGTPGRSILNYLLASGQTLPNNSYLCEEGRKRAIVWREDMPPRAFQTHCWASRAHLCRASSARRQALPQQGVTLQLPLWKRGKRLLVESSAL